MQEQHCLLLKPIHSFKWHVICRRGMERLLRKVLSMPNRPAIINFHFYPFLRFK